MTRHVVVLAGGLTHEREVSLRSGSRLTEALRRQGLEVTVRDADAALLPWLTEAKPDAAIIALHGGRGENGAMQGVLEMAGVPYLGHQIARLPAGLGQTDRQEPGAARRVHRPPTGSRWRTTPFAISAPPALIDLAGRPSRVCR